MKVRVILVCTLLLLAAAPSFALPLCQDCNELLRCEPIPGASIERCFSGPGYCYTTPQLCSIPHAAATVLTEWQVSSVEISRSLDALTVKAPAQAPQTEARKPEPVEQK